MEITIIGAGNMGGATALGLARFGKGISLTVTAAHERTLEKYKASGMAASLDNRCAAEGADLVILGVKPWIAGAVLEEIRPALAGKVLCSMAAGIPDGDLLTMVEGSGVKAVYTVIPNLAIEVGESMTYVHRIRGDAETDTLVMDLFDTVGKTRLADGKQLHAGMILASCGTAFAMRYFRAATEGGVQLGLYPKDALEAVLQTVKGAADLLEARGTHPEQEVDRVTTPGGITIRGLNAMEEAGFTNAVIRGLSL